MSCSLITTIRNWHLGSFDEVLYQSEFHSRKNQPNKSSGPQALLEQKPPFSHFVVQNTKDFALLASVRFQISQLFYSISRNLTIYRRKPPNFTCFYQFLQKFHHSSRLPNITFSHHHKQKFHESSRFHYFGTLIGQSLLMLCLADAIWQSQGTFSFHASSAQFDSYLQKFSILSVKDFGCSTCV